MALVDPEYAAWLSRDENQAVATSAPAAAKWGALAVDTEISSAIAGKVDADAEAARQLAFMGVDPPAIERLRVPGNQIGLIGHVVKLHATKAGYAGGLNVFVLFADETSEPGSTVLTVLRRM